MSRISKAFEKKAFIAFLTGGDPSLALTEEYILEMVRGGADLIEIGIPFSDPIAEGPVIQEANIRALKDGATTQKMFELVSSVRQKTDVPLVFLTYLNPVYHYGYDAFFKQCEISGVDGIIIPDLPHEERQEVVPFAQKYNVDMISLIAPTSKERIQMLAQEAQGFVYLVSSMGVTGVRSELYADLEAMVTTAKAATDVPCAVGFGINTAKQAGELAQYADGVIVGSAIVKLIEKHGKDAGSYLYEYVKEMKAAMSQN